MTILDASTGTADFNMSDGTLVNLGAYRNSSSTTYNWETAPAPGGAHLTNYVYTYGTGIGIDGANYPVSGSITDIKLDFEHDGDPNTNIGIDALLHCDTPVALTDLVSPFGTDVYKAADKFWETLLSGDDTIYAPDEGGAFLFGDFLDIHSTILAIESKTGGNDVISADPTEITLVFGRGETASTALVGDAYSVSGSVFSQIAYFGQLTGGADKITLTGLAGYNLIGDAYFVSELGDVVGGADTLRSDAYVDGFGGFDVMPALIGDVFDNGGYTTGGKDKITGSNFAFLDEILAGDVFRQLGTTQGGKDTINGRAGHDFIAGESAIAAGSVTGAGDTLMGGEDADIISGDVLQAGSLGPFGTLGDTALVSNVAGGNDTIRGEEGNDIVAGDIYWLQGIQTSSTISGGNDNIYGGDGDDTIYGDFGPATYIGPSDFLDDGGNDTLTGGAGNDTQYGGVGNDVFVVEHAADSINEEINGGDGNDRIRFSATSGNEKLVLSNLVTDVEVAEIAGADGGATDAPLSIDASAVGAAMSLKGNDGNNGLAGTSFDDTLTGGLGADVIEGRGGADRFVYQAAADSTGPGYDTVKGADFAADAWDLPGAVNAVDATIASGRLTTANFDTQLEAAADAAHLAKRHAVLFTPDEGNLAGKTFLVVDMNGTAGYQGGEDLVVLLNAPKHLGALDAADFV